MANEIVIIWIVVLAIAGFVAFSLAMTFLGWLLRLLFGLLGIDSPNRPGYLHAQPRSLLCGFDRCGHVNPRGALFCGRCGRPLPARDAVELHG